MPADIREVIKASSHVSLLPWETRFIQNDEELKTAVARIKSAGLTLVLTMGTWDLLHIGHGRYLREARMRGDVLLVGVDDDKKARGRKGTHRPVVPQNERLEMLAYQRYVDLVVLKSIEEERWSLIKVVTPDVLIAVEGTYAQDDIPKIQKFCGEVVVLPRQAETSTSAKTRKLVLDGAETFMRSLLPRLTTSVEESVEKTYQELHGEAEEKVQNNGR